MKKIIISIISICIFVSTAQANQDIRYCNNCKVYNTRKVVKNYYPQVVNPYTPMIYDQPVPVYTVPDVYPMYTAPPVAIPMYSVPAPVAAIQQPTPVCAWYVDPYDLFGQLFGNPDLVQSCAYY